MQLYAKVFLGYSSVARGFYKDTDGFSASELASDEAMRKKVSQTSKSQRRVLAGKQYWYTVHNMSYSSFCMYSTVSKVKVH